MIGIYILALVFLLLSITFLMGKGSWLIAGYNTSSKEEKEKYDEKKLCRTMGIMCAIIAVLTGLLAFINKESFAIVYGIVLCITVIITLIFLNTKCKKH